MQQSISSAKTLISLIVFLSLISTGCATSRNVVSLKMEATSNPSQGTPIRIEKVEDLRHFEAKPSDPSIPSLKDGNITDESLRHRAIARKRGAYGQALGDVLLAENETVSMLTEQAVANSFKAAGFRVLSANDAEYATATPVTVKIERLWAWFTPGFWSIKLESNYSIALKSSLINAPENGLKLTGHTNKSMQLATESDWEQIVKKSLEDFSSQLKVKLQLK